VIVPQIQEAWDQCLEVFGKGNVLIVSNSAGTLADPGAIQCESVTYHTRAPVLRHRSLKPAYSCINMIRRYFSSLTPPVQDEALIVVGDRVFTDVVMANRMRRGMGHSGMMKITSTFKGQGGIANKESDPNQLDGPLAIWTTGVWEKEATGIRCLERSLVRSVRWSIGAEDGDWTNTGRFVRKFPEPEPSRRDGVMARLFEKLKGT